MDILNSNKNYHVGVWVYHLSGRKIRDAIKCNKNNFMESKMEIINIK